MIDKCAAEGKPFPTAYTETVNSVLQAHRDDLDRLALRVLDGRDLDRGVVQQKSGRDDDSVPAE